MGATVIKLNLSGKKGAKNKKPTPIQKKLLTGPTMTKKQIKEYEKLYPWLKNYKD